jgi:hypothetical protein
MKTKQPQEFAVSRIEGKKYITTVYKGTEYCLSMYGAVYGVQTNRVALGRFNAGGFKYYANLAAVAEGCKAFPDSELIAMLYP